MPEKSKHIEIKILAGYLLLILVALFSVFFLFDKISRLSAPDAEESEMRHKRSLISNTLTLLYESESDLQALNSGHIRSDKRYRAAFDRIYRNIDTLKQLVSDTLQKQRMDSILILLAEKESSALAWLKLQQNAQLGNLYEKNIQKEISRRDSLFSSPQVRQKTVIKQDTLTIQNPRKKFFKRLADAFSTKKSDENTVYSQSKQLITDTIVHPYNAADTIAGIFSDVQYAVLNQQKQIRNQASLRSEVLRRNNQVLSSKINNLVREFEQEELARSLVRYENRDIMMRNSVRVVGGIAIFSLIMVVLFVIFIWRDISRSNRYRKELGESNRRGEDLLKSREQLMLTITHDIKAPLSSIIGYIELLSGHITEPRARYYLGNMKSSSDHLLQLVTDLLDYHRLESDKMEIHNVPFEPYRFFKEIGESFIPVAGKKGLEMKISIDDRLQYNCSGDPFRIRQITNNLLSNAIKFTSEGYVLFSVERDNDTLIIRVEDTGMGIAEEDRERVFKEFTRLSGAQGAEGFGLGLSITEKLVKLLGGSISFESVLEQGTCFTVILPFEELLSKPDNCNSRLGDESVDTGVQVHCLLVDDDKLQLELTAALLQCYHLTSVSCQYPEQVIQLLSEQNFDLVFTDIQMPGISGFDLVRQIRQSDLSNAKTVPVIALTARSGMNDDEFLSAGFTARLNKPFSGRDLLNIIQKYCSEYTAVDFPDEIVSGKSNTFDFSALLAFAGDDKDAAKEILLSFISETGQSLERFRDAYLHQNVNMISAISHKLIPLFTLLNCNECVDILMWLEKLPGGFSPEIEEKCRIVDFWIVEVISRAKENLSV